MKEWVKQKKFSQVSFGTINLSRIFLIHLSFFHICTTRYSSPCPHKINFLTQTSSVKTYTPKYSPLFKIPCSLSLVPDSSPPHIKKNSHPPPFSIPSWQNYLTLPSSLRGTSLLWFSSIPSYHYLHSNLTLKSMSHSLAKNSSVTLVYRIKSRVLNPRSRPCSLTLHTSTILNHHLVP